MKNINGFSLIELIIVIAIIGILAGIGIPAYIGQQKNAARSEAITQLEGIIMLEESFNQEGQYTGSAADVAAIKALLPGFKPGPDLKFNYSIVSGFEITGTNPLAFGANANCFYARAIGIPGTRVAGEDFAIDCNNNKNF